MLQIGFIKACNFYVSEWHLFATMLPFIRDELKFENQVAIISQDNLKYGMKKMMDKVDIHFYNQNGIKDVMWYKNYQELEIESSVNPINIFVQGTVEYINEANQYINECYSKIYREIRIIDCYELYDSNPFLYEILDKHDYVFNTGGLKRKEYVFPDYKESALVKRS